MAAPGEGIHEDAIDLVLGVPAVGVNRPNCELDPCRLAVPAIDSYQEVSPIQLGLLPASLILPLLLLGALAASSPATIVVFILVLTTTSRLHAVAFLVGWGVSLTIVFAVAFAIGGTCATQGTEGRIGVDVVEIVLGLVMVVAGVRRWQRRNTPRPSSGASKALATRLNQLHPLGSNDPGVEIKVSAGRSSGVHSCQMRCGRPAFQTKSSPWSLPSRLAVGVGVLGGGFYGRGGMSLGPLAEDAPPMSARGAGPDADSCRWAQNPGSMQVEQDESK